MTPERLAALRALAEKATAGPWEYELHPGESHMVMVHTAGGPFAVAITRKDTGGVDARYIAALDPQTCRALLDRIAELEESVADLEQEREADPYYRQLQGTRTRLVGVEAENADLRTRLEEANANRRR